MTSTCGSFTSCSSEASSGARTVCDGVHGSEEAALGYFTAKKLMDTITARNIRCSLYIVSLAMESITSMIVRTAEPRQVHRILLTQDFSVYSLKKRKLFLGFVSLAHQFNGRGTQGLWKIFFHSKMFQF